MRFSGFARLVSRPARISRCEPRRRLGSLWQLSKENKFFSWALLAGALLRLDAMLGYPGALWFAGDSERRQG
jgi:hypothetical protein